MTTALITGATSGIGLEFARKLAARGHDLVLVARDRERLTMVAAELARQHNVHTELLVADLADRAQVELVADRAGESERPIDILVNNAGFGLPKDFLKTEVADEERLLDVLCRAVLVTSHAAGKAMAARGQGTIVNVASVAAFTAMGSYSAAKAWVVSFSEGLAAELAPAGVQVTVLCPGFTHTEFHERARMNMSKLPEALWLDADDLVMQCLDDIAKGKVISVPGLAYKAVTGVLKVTPRAVIRKVGGGISTKRRPQNRL